MAVEAMWDAFDAHDDPEQESPISEAEEQVFLAISKAAVMGSTSPRTVRFSGNIQGQPVHILLDSGSSASFLSESVAARLSHVRSEPIST